VARDFEAASWTGFVSLEVSGADLGRAERTPPV
jgi:hypothetical protein